MKKLAAFTLQELLIVLVIIGILMLLALPNFLPLITKAKSTEAKLQLEHLAQLEKTYYLEYSRYTKDLTSIPFEQEPLVTESEIGRANYRIELIDADAASFLGRATSVVDFDGDGEYNVWEIDQTMIIREITRD
jgi:type IV pilus assembly protein PilE